MIGGSTFGFPWPVPSAALDRRIHELETILNDCLRRHERIEQSYKSERKLSSTLRKEVEKLQRELNESRSFTQSVDTGDLSSVSRAFLDLESEVNDVVDGLLGEAQYRSMNHYHSFVNRTKFKDCLGTYSRFEKIRSEVGSDLGQFFDSSFRHEINRMLIENIFERFSIANANVEQLYSQVQESYTQDKVGRWRSISSSALVAQSTGANGYYADEFARNLIHTCINYFNFFHLAVDLTQQFPKVQAIFTKAILLRQHLQANYLSYEIEVSPKSFEFDEIECITSLRVLTAVSVETVDGIRIERKILINGDVTFIPIKQVESTPVTQFSRMTIGPPVPTYPSGLPLVTAKEQIIPPVPLAKEEIIALEQAEIVTRSVQQNRSREGGVRK